MDQPDFTPRNIAKFAAQGVVQLEIAKRVKPLIADFTGFESDNTFVTLGAHVIGWGVSAKLKPFTDKGVDLAADKIIELRQNRAQKKNDKKKDDK